MNILNKILKLTTLLSTIALLSFPAYSQVSNTYYNLGFTEMNDHLNESNLGKVPADYYQIYVDKFLSNCSNVKNAYNGSVDVFNPGDPRLPASACFFTLGAKDAVGRHINKDYKLSSPSDCDRSAVPSNDPAVSSQYNKTDRINISWSQCKASAQETCSSEVFDLRADSFPVKILLPEKAEGTQAYNVEALEQGQKCAKSTNINGLVADYVVSCSMDAKCSNGSWKATNTTCECVTELSGSYGGLNGKGCCGRDMSWTCRSQGCGCYPDVKSPGRSYYPSECP